MTLTRKNNSVTFPASGDLSGNQFRLMTIDGNGRIVVSATVATPFVGVLLNKPDATDREGEVAIVGSIVKIEAGVAVAERDAITAVAGGRGSPAVTNNDYIVGRAVSPAAGSGEFFECEINPDRVNS